MDEIKEKVQVLGSIILVFFGGVAGGSILRGEWSPWVWEQISNRPPTYTGLDLVLETLWYFAFYSLGFLMPFWTITIVLSLSRERAGGDTYDGFPVNQRHGRLFVSLAGLVFFLLFLEPLMAFVRAIPFQAWNGWPLILGVSIGGLLLYSGFGRLLGRK